MPPSPRRGEGRGEGALLKACFFFPLTRAFGATSPQRGEEEPEAMA